MVVCEHVDRFMRQPTGPHSRSLPDVSGIFRDHCKITPRAMIIFPFPII